jgi:hypothetical protein
MYFYCGFFFSDTPQADFTTSNPATTNNYGIAPYTTDGTNPATMKIAQPPPYPSTTSYDNHIRNSMIYFFINIIRSPVLTMT